MTNKEQKFLKVALKFFKKHSKAHNAKKALDNEALKDMEALAQMRQLTDDLIEKLCKSPEKEEAA